MLLFHCADGAARNYVLPNKTVAQPARRGTLITSGTISRKSTAPARSGILELRSRPHEVFVQSSCQCRRNGSFRLASFPRPCRVPFCIYMPLVAPLAHSPPPGNTEQDKSNLIIASGMGSPGVESLFVVLALFQAIDGPSGNPCVTASFMAAFSLRGLRGLRDECLGTGL
jgi:hypothetical protein